ncbi:MAG TPA: hypothetical protein VGF74_12695 [Thermoleophilaceae bacterium]
MARDVLTHREVRICNEHPKAFVNRVRVLAGDRKDDPRMRNPNQTDAAKGIVAMTTAERKLLYAAVDKLIAAIGAATTR